MFLKQVILFAVTLSENGLRLLQPKHRRMRVDKVQPMCLSVPPGVREQRAASTQREQLALLQV